MQLDGVLFLFSTDPELLRECITLVPFRSQRDTPVSSAPNLVHHQGEASEKGECNDLFEAVRIKEVEDEKENTQKGESTHDVVEDDKQIDVLFVPLRRMGIWRRRWCRRWFHLLPLVGRCGSPAREPDG